MINESNDFLAGIKFRQIESYDCTKENVLAFRRKNDIWNGITINLGNMCNGYPFEIAGVPFHNSECAYIAGAYSRNDPESIRIQQLISEERNGLKCKRIYRNKEEFTKYIRNDWNEYNVQWMLYVVWQKTIQSKQFSDLLRQIPVDVHVVENSSFQRGVTATFWGASNDELIALKKNAGKNSVRGVFDKGIYSGYNVMGKIIKLCSLCLIYGQEPPICNDLLDNKRLFISGKLMEFY